MALPKENERYTYTDYCSWDNDERWELIDGVPYAMTPAPSRFHQNISGNLFGQLFNYLQGKPCKVYHAPFDVRLNTGTNDDTVVQPDLLVVCDSSKLDDKGCVGAPDLVVEILSPSTARKDKLIKFQKYQQSGIREFWIIDPETRTVQVCTLENGNYIISMYGDTDTVHVQVLDGCQIELCSVFAE
ncbi:MAG: Uma2 family endonuclease [Peptococcaceae bacterium]|nr:Uma2 family endonuclease [Peptococcaceae bacterium]